MPEDAKPALYRLGRELLYRKLPLVGRRLRIESLEHVEPVLRELVAPWVSPDAPWDGCSLVGGLAKYGLVDRWYTAPSGLLDDPSTLVGVPALRENGLGQSREAEKDPEEEAIIAEVEAGCLIDLAADLDSGVLLKLFLEDDNTDELRERRTRHMKATHAQIWQTGEMTMMPDYFPRELTVTDACVTNARGIWAGKHFYM